MNHKEKLLNIYNSSFSITETELNSIPANYRQFIDVIGKQAYKQKGVFTVLITLLIHKLLHPEQDIRKHQAKMAGGFAARIIDTQLITPTLKELELPSMAESGWLTRSLEQPHPYNLDYPGKIRNTTVKEGKGKVQEEAIDEIQQLPVNHPLRSNILTLLTNFQANLQTTETLEPEERSLIMKLSPLYIQWEQEALKRGEEQGIQQEKRLMIESMLEVKFGTIDDELSQIVEALIQLPTKEVTQLIMQSNRDELLSRFQ